MKKNYNPYTVPEGFFEDITSRAVSAHARRARTLKYAFLSAAVAAVLLVIPAVAVYRAEPSDRSRQECRADELPGQDVRTDGLAGMYDYDIFLQVSF